MIRKEIIEKAITELKEMERPHKGELLPAWWVLDKILKHVDKALALLEQAEPPAGEFTQTARTFLPPKTCFDSAYKSVSLGHPTQLEWLLHEACDRLDAQQQEIERLKEAQKQHCDTINRMDGNAEQMDKNYGQIVLERDALQVNNKAQAERIEKLEKYQHFYNHIQAHLTPDQIVICKICGKSLEEIEQALKGEKA